MLIPWFEPEITPPVLTPRVHRYRLSPDDAAGNVRGVVEAQMMAMAIHSRWMGSRDRHDSRDGRRGSTLAAPERASRIAPDPVANAVYRRMLPLYAACEAHALGHGPDPTSALTAAGF